MRSGSAAALRFGNLGYVMAGLDPVIHVFFLKRHQTWMPGTSPGLTS
jgi:hypothetical protein